MTIYRAVWVGAGHVKRFLNREPIFPDGVGSEEELRSMRIAAEQNFGSLEFAALHHMTGASGIAPNKFGKPVFAFWSRKREVALSSALSSHPGSPGFILVLLRADVAKEAGVIIAEEDGLYDQRVSDLWPDTFDGLRDNDEVLIAIPVRSYDVDVIDTCCESHSAN